MLAEGKRTPIQKKSAFYTTLGDKFGSHRALDFDSAPQKTSSMGSPRPAPFHPSNMNFQQMLQSPYVIKNLVPATPAHKALDLMAWLEEKAQRAGLFADGKITTLPPQSPLNRFLESLDAELQHRLFKRTVETILNQLIESEMAGLPKNSKENAKQFFAERKTLFMNFYLSCLSEIIHREQKIRNMELEAALRNPDFHKTLLIFCAETIYFVLGVTSVDFQSALEISELSCHTLYSLNLHILNFENLVPSPLKSHLLNIERQIISYLLWEKPSHLLTCSPQGDQELILERIMRYAGTLVCSLAEQLHMNPKFAEAVWELFKAIFIKQRDLFTGRFLDQIVMCCFYALAKTCNLKLRFQDVISKFQAVASFHTASVLQSIIHDCLLLDGNLGDIIQLYNKVFILEVRTTILEHGRKFNEQEFERSEKNEDENEGQRQVIEVPADGRCFSRNAGALPVMCSPLRTLTATPFVSYLKEKVRGPADVLGSPTLHMT